MGKHEDLIVEMLDRIIKLEKEVEKLKSQQIINGSSFGPVEPPDVIGEDQLYDYAARRGMPADVVRKFIIKE